MVAAHVLDARHTDGRLAWHVWLVEGRASALFAVLAGVSLALMSRRTNAVGLAVRAVLVALLGLGLGELESGLAVILTYYGLLFLLGLPFLRLRASALFAWAAAWVVIGPVVSQLVRPHLAPRSGPSPAFDQLENPGHLLAELMFTGYYPCAALARLPAARAGHRPVRPALARGAGPPARGRPRAGGRGASWCPAR